MKYAVIDIGSNSVRLMMSDGVKSIYKKVKNTRLAEGMKDGFLSSEAIKRTALAVSEFYFVAKKENADKIYCFATAAVRQAKNPELFINEVNKLCGLTVEVIKGEKEAELGLKGVLGGCDGGVIDVGGASTEIAIINDGNIIYSKSINIGAVKLKDACGQDRKLSEIKVLEAIKEFGEIFNTKFFAIGGTATSISSMMQELVIYNPEIVDGFKICKNELKNLVDKLYSLTVEERKNLKGLQPERAEVIAGGALILLKLMQNFNIESVTVSESDNLEGYLMTKMEKL